MASVNYLYRSTKDNSHLVLRLLFRHNQKDYTIEAKTKVLVSKDYWTKEHNLKRAKSIDIINQQASIKSDLSNLEISILKAFDNSNKESLSKQWLEKAISDYYFPSDNALPIDLLSYVDQYIEFKRSEVTITTVRKSNVIKQLLIRYENSIGQKLLIKDINSFFKVRFERYCENHGYAPNTIARALRFVKTVCSHARVNGADTNNQLDKIKIRYHKADSIYLTESEILILEEKNDLPDYLENAKDWLLVSCYTGQRVSDFMRFTREMIRYEKNRSGDVKPFIEFKQQKTGKLMTVPLSEKAIQILEKRNGEFPRQISDQKYNTFIKQVCKLAGINEKVFGSRVIEKTPGSKLYRKTSSEFEKWELVSSHIGRRSFATNNYGKIPTSFLKYITGHSTETLFLTYIGKSNKDIALELSNYL